MRLNIRIGVLLTGVFAVLISIMFGNILLDQQDHRADLAHHIEDQAIAETFRTIYQLDPYLEGENWSAASQVINSATTQVLPQRFRLYDLAGNNLLDIRSDQGYSAPILTLGDIERVGRLRDMLILHDDAAYRIRILVPIFNSSGLIAVAVNDIHWQDEYVHLVEEDREHILLLMAPVLLVAGFLLVVLRELIGKPLNSLETLMKAVVSGGSSERAGRFFALELHNVGQAVNTMLDSVQERENLKELELRRQKEIDVELRRYRDQLEQLVEVRTVDLNRSRQTAQDFQEYLKILHQTNLDFSLLDSVDAICRSAVEQGLAKFGFDRMGLFLLDDEQQYLYGTYGTDDGGNIRSEADYRTHISRHSEWLVGVMQNKERAKLWENVELIDYDQKMPFIGWNGMGALWDGDRVLGYFAVDNLTSKRDPRPFELEMLSLYGTTIGHAIARQRAIEERIQSEMRFRTVLEQAPVAILMSDADGRVMLSNQSANVLFEYTDHGLVDQNIHNLLPGLRAALGEAKWQNLLLADESDRTQLTSFGHDLSGMTKSGSRFAAETVLTSIQLGADHVVMAFVRDMSQHQQAEKQRLELSLERERTTILSRFIRDAAHEFGTPLSIIRTALYIMNKKQGDIQIIQDQQERIRQQAEHIHALVSALTTMARLDSTVYQNLDAVNLYEMVSSISEEYSGKCQWKMQVTEHNAWIRGHVSDLSLAIGNIFSNAVRFAPGKNVEIRLDRVGDCIRLRVADHGEGMPEEVLNRVFERFYRGDDAHSTRGFGLGLSIARRVVELHHGTIEVESAPGKGTTVTLTFPADGERLQSA